MSEEVGVITLPMPMRLGSVNCYLLRGGGGFVLVDTGPSSARAQFGRELGRLGCAAGSLRLIALTHGDFDHTGNAVYARDAYGGVLAMHTDDAGMAELGDMFVNRKPPHPVLRALLPMLTGFGASERFIPDVLLSAGDSLAAYGLDAQVHLRSRAFERVHRHPDRGWEPVLWGRAGEHQGAGGRFDRR